MITKSKWISIVRSIYNEMKSKGTIYGWKSPVNEANTLKKSTCVGPPSLALQRAGLLPEGKYVHLSNGQLAGTGVSYIRSHPGIYEIKWVRATPQKLGSNLKEGDICLYTVPHIQVFAGRDKKGTPLWYSLERGKGGVGKPAQLTLSGVFSYYSKRKIECVIRLKFDDSEEKKPASTNTSASTSKPAAVKYKLKQAMNFRSKPNAKATILRRIPKGAVLKQIKKSGSWIYTDYCGEDGWVNISSKYATKI